MVEKRRYEAIAGIDPAELVSFQTAIRKRYSDEQILAELRSHARRLGRSPTVKECAADPDTRVHPQTVIEHFGTWNAAKRAAFQVPKCSITVCGCTLVSGSAAHSFTVGERPRRRACERSSARICSSE